MYHKRRSKKSREILEERFWKRRKRSDVVMSEVSPVPCLPAGRDPGLGHHPSPLRCAEMVFDQRLSEAEGGDSLAWTTIR